MNNTYTLEGKTPLIPIPPKPIPTAKKPIAKPIKIRYHGGKTSPIATPPPKPTTK